MTDFGLSAEDWEELQETLKEHKKCGHTPKDDRSPVGTVEDAFSWCLVSSKETAPSTMHIPDEGCLPGYEPLCGTATSGEWVAKDVGVLSGWEWCVLCRRRWTP